MGTVRDPSGAAVADARVTVTNQRTNATFVSQTDATGDYVVPSLPPSVYRIEVEREGFKKTTVPDVVVEVDHSVRVDVRLDVGLLTEVVEVTGVSPLVQADSVTLGQVVRTRQIEELPLNGRDFTNLLRLNVGVGETQGGITTAPTIRRHGLNDNFRLVSVNGARPASVSYLIDGVTANDSLFQSISVRPPIDAIQEFKLQNGLYSAEFGMGSAQVNVALKAGSNEFHGSLWEFIRNDAFQRQHPFFHRKDPLKQHQFGLAGGGPVWIPGLYRGTDRTFFYASYQGGLRRTGGIGQARVPTEREKQGDFSGWRVPLYDPLSSRPNPAYRPGAPASVPPVLRDPFPGNMIPGPRMAPQSRNLLAYWPAPNLDAAFPLPNYQRVVAPSIDVHTFTVRGDHYLGTNDRLFGTFVLQNEEAPNPATIPLSGTKTIQNGRMASLQWSRVISPRTINEARIGYNRLFLSTSFETAFGAVNYWREAGLKNLRDDPAYYALPAIILGTGYSGIGNGGSLPFFNISNIFHFVDHLTLIRGRHNLKAGADVRRHRNTNISGFGGNGLLNFQGQFTAFNPTVAQVAQAPFTGNAFADFLLGYPNGAPAYRGTPFDQSFAQLRSTDVMLFLQDDVRVSSRLTLNLGLRWEFHTPYSEKSGGGRIFDFSYPGGRVLYRDRAFTQLFNNEIFAACCAKDTLIDTDWRSFAPRLGIAWRPLGSSERFVVRAGYGIFYDVLHNYYPAGSLSKNIPFLTPSLPNPTGTETTPPLDIRNMFPAPYSISERRFPPPYCGAPSSDVIDPRTGVVAEVRNACPSAQTQLPDNRTPYTQQWGLNIQWELVQNLLLEVGYQGSRGLRLPIQWIFNQAVLPPETGNPNHGVTFRSQCPVGQSCSAIQERVPYRNFIRNTFANANILQSVHHAMTVKVDKRFSHGLQGQLSFTWGRTIDQFSEIQNVGGAISSIAQYAHRFDLERGPANFDQTRRLVVNWIYELPFGAGKALLDRPGWINRIFGGWQVNGIQTLADGTPFTVGCFCGDRSQTGNIFNTHRPDVTGNPLPEGFERSITRWFDTSKFVLPPLGRLGTAGRNILRSTGQRATDFSLFKNNRIGERTNVQIRAEFFNLFASKYYFPRFPNNNLSSTDFGSFIPLPRPGDPPSYDEGFLFNPRIVQLGLRIVF